MKLVSSNSCPFNRYITVKNLTAIENARNSDDVIEPWDAIADMVCGTNKVEAKKALYFYLNGNKQEQLKGFSDLKQLVYQDEGKHFQIEGKKTTSSIDIRICTPLKHFNTRIDLHDDNVNLHNIDLSGATLEDTDLHGVRFDGANLSGARLAGANLCGASFCHADLTHATLENVELVGATFWNANLTNTKIAVRGPDVCGTRDPATPLNFKDQITDILLNVVHSMDTRYEATRLSLLNNLFQSLGQLYTPVMYQAVLDCWTENPACQAPPLSNLFSVYFSRYARFATIGLSDPNSAAREWMKVADWFDGTNQDDAQYQLFSLLAAESKQEVLDAFLRLKRLALEDRKRSFQIVAVPNSAMVNICTSVSGQPNVYRQIELSGLMMQNAPLSEINLCNTTLTDIDLENADLSYAELINVELNRVNFKGAKLTFAGITCIFPEWNNDNLNQYLDPASGQSGGALIATIESISDDYRDLKVAVMCDLMSSLERQLNLEFGTGNVTTVTSSAHDNLLNFCEAHPLYGNNQKISTYVKRCREFKQDVANRGCDVALLFWDFFNGGHRLISEDAKDRLYSFLTAQGDQAVLNAFAALKNLLRHSCYACTNEDSAEILLVVVNWNPKYNRKISSVRLQAPGVNFSYCELPFAALDNANLHGCDLGFTNLEYANLSNANMKEVNLIGANFRGANLAGATITCRLPERWDANQLYLYLNHLNNNNRSLLTAINSISDDYRALKLAMMHELIASLSETDVSSAHDILMDMWLGNPIYCQDKKITDYIFENMLRALATEANSRPLKALGDAELNLYLNYLEPSPADLDDKSTEQAKKAKHRFMMANNGFFIQLMMQSLTHENATIRSAAAKRYIDYLELPELAMAKHYLAQGGIQIDSLTANDADDTAFAFVNNNQTSILLLSKNAIVAMLQNDMNHDWANVVVFRDGSCIAAPDLNKLYADFNLFTAAYIDARNQNKFPRLLRVLDLDRSNVVPEVSITQTNYRALIEDAIGRSVSHVKLCDAADQNTLKQIFATYLKKEGQDDELQPVGNTPKREPNYLADVMIPAEIKCIADIPVVKDSHFDSIVKSFMLQGKTNTERSQTLLSLATVFAWLSSSRMFGISQESPIALRYYAAALMKKSWQLDSTVFGGVDNYTNWMSRLAGFPLVFECTEVLAVNFIKPYILQQDESFIAIFNAIKPPGL